MQFTCKYSKYMSTTNRTKDMAKNPASQDWHKADIVAAVHKTGQSLRRMAIAQGYKDQSSLAQALHRPYPTAERLIAEVIGVTPQTIWPSRYHEDGTPKSGRGERGLGRYKAKCSKPVNSGPGNVK